MMGKRIQGAPIRGELVVYPAGKICWSASVREDQGTALPLPCLTAFTRLRQVFLG